MRPVALLASLLAPTAVLGLPHLNCVRHLQDRDHLDRWPWAPDRYREIIIKNSPNNHAAAGGVVGEERRSASLVEGYLDQSCVGHLGNDHLDIGGGRGHHLDRILKSLPNNQAAGGGAGEERGASVVEGPGMSGGDDDAIAYAWYHHGEDNASG